MKKRGRNRQYSISNRPERLGDVLSEIKHDLLRAPINLEWDRARFNYEGSETSKRYMRKRGITQELINKPLYKTAKYRQIRENDFAGFIDEIKDDICRKRRQKRISMMVNQSAGKGRSIKTRKKFTEESKVRC